MSYVDTNLIPGETVIYRARLHWAVMAPALVAGSILDLAGCGLLIAAFLWPGPKAVFTMPLVLVGAVLGVAGSVVVAGAALRKSATEIAVTSRRVLVKTGIVSRHTTEVLLSKVESVSIEETPAGRTLGFGSVMIHGTGGTPESLDRISDPNEFRRQIQAQIDVLPSNVGMARIA